jgi:hypothetical protein
MARGLRLHVMKCKCGREVRVASEDVVSVKCSVCSNEDLRAEHAAVLEEPVTPTSAVPPVVCIPVRVVRPPEVM